MDVGRLVQHFLDCAVVTPPELLFELHLSHVDGEGCAIGEVDTCRVQDSLSVEIESA